MLKEIFVQFCLESLILDFPSSNFWWWAHTRNLHPEVVCLLMVINCWLLMTITWPSFFSSTMKYCHHLYHIFLLRYCCTGLFCVQGNYKGSECNVSNICDNPTWQAQNWILSLWQQHNCRHIFNLQVIPEQINWSQSEL